MLGVQVNLEGDGAWPDAPKAERWGEVTHACRMTAGMQSGLSSVAIRGKTKDGTEVALEVSMRMFQTIAAAFSAAEAKLASDMANPEKQ